jgi:ectoine hydroxylase-related dioxygenase (phytanoyl-CoA dioxygenase family)
MAALTADQKHQFGQEGYVVVHGLFDPEADLRPIIAEYEQVLDRLATELHAAGKISQTYAELPFSQRLIEVYKESGQVHAQYFDFSLPQSGITHDTPFWAGPAVFRILRHPELLDAIESLIGPEIFSNPVQHIRLKPPEHLTPRDEQTGQVQLGATPWHQDQGVITEEADESDIITVWFPLTEATEENGCLAVATRSHQEGLLPHCPASAENRTGFGVHIKERLIDGRMVLPLPMKPGSALFMTKRTIHCSLSNTSDHVRFSFDLRYNPIGQPTGRGDFPGFVARSRSNPRSELHDPVAWRDLWVEARSSLAERENPKFNRWDPNSPSCA